MDMSLRIIGDPVLRRECPAVSAFDEELQERIQSMYQCMVEEEGIGLAAPQVGNLEQLLVIGIPQDDDSLRLKAFLNPEILAVRGECVMEEGCLSIPGIRADVSRPARIQLKWQEPDGSEAKAWFEDLEARVLQHEIDHLKGILFIDRLSPEERTQLQPAIRRLQEQHGTLDA